MAYTSDPGPNAAGANQSPSAAFTTLGYQPDGSLAGSSRVIGVNVAGASKAYPGVHAAGVGVVDVTQGTYATQGTLTYPLSGTVLMVGSAIWNCWLIFTPPFISASGISYFWPGQNQSTVIVVNNGSVYSYGTASYVVSVAENYAGTVATSSWAKQLSNGITTITAGSPSLRKVTGVHTATNGINFTLTLTGSGSTS